MELLGDSQSTYGDMVAELGLSTEMSAEGEYTLLGLQNAVFTGESHRLVISCMPFCFPLSRQLKINACSGAV